MKSPVQQVRRWEEGSRDGDDTGEDCRLSQEVIRGDVVAVKERHAYGQAAL